MSQLTDPDAIPVTTDLEDDPHYRQRLARPGFHLRRLIIFLLLIALCFAFARYPRAFVHLLLMLLVLQLVTNLLSILLARLFALKPAVVYLGVGPVVAWRRIGAVLFCLAFFLPLGGGVRFSGTQPDSTQGLAALSLPKRLFLFLVSPALWILLGYALSAALNDPHALQHAFAWLSVPEHRSLPAWRILTQGFLANLQSSTAVPRAFAHTLLATGILNLTIHAFLTQPLSALQTRHEARHGKNARPNTLLNLLGMLGTLAIFALIALALLIFFTALFIP